MRATAFVACLFTAGCASALIQPATNYPAVGDARPLASCAYREMREMDTWNVRLTPLDDIGAAEVQGSIMVCRLHCVETVMFMATFRPDGAGRTSIAVQESLNLTTNWRRVIQPAVARCSARLADAPG